jgi:RNA polymerase sigma factor (sigma-70 family)
MTDSRQLLADFAQTLSETAFREIVESYLNLVYSTALRLVDGDDHRARDVAQIVFVDFAAKAAELSPEVMLGGWLHRHTCFVAANIMRGERRRLAREREAVEMNLLHENDGLDFAQVAPLLDETINRLEEADRTAILLRFYEQKDFQAVGLSLDTSEDAARMRVNRALDKLRDLLAQHGIRTTAGALGVVITAHAVQAAPVGLAASISTAVLTGTTGAAAAIVTKTIVMPTLQKILVGATAVVLAGAGIYEATQAAKLRSQNERLQQQQATDAAQIQKLQSERDADTNRIAELQASIAAAARPNTSEVLKLRGEVGALKTQNRMAGEKSALSKITSDPSTRNAIREQQKYGMKAIYGDFAKKLQLSPDQTEKFNDMMADSVMENIDRITQILHDGTSSAEADKIFADANAGLEGKVQAMLGDQAAAQFKDYNQNLLSTLGTAQFADNLTGAADEKKQKGAELQQAIQQAMTQVIQQNGLPANFQFVPSLNFANFTSEATLNRNLNLLDTVLADAASTSSSFLSPEEQASLQTFRTNALNNNRMLIEMNQKLMSPLSQ